MKRLLSILLLTGCVTTAGTRSVPAGQGSIHVDDGGHGTALPVIFVHGNGTNLTQWRAQLEHVRRSRRAIAFDLPGMGLSDPPKDGNVSVDRFADSIGAVADALHVRRFVLVGHSYGGSVVMAYAAKHPERVAGLVLADAAGHVQMSDEGAAKFLAALRKNNLSFIG